MTNYRLSALLFSLVLICSPASANEWRTAEGDNSSISFVASYDETPFTGTFSSFRSVINMDERYATSFIYAEVDMTSFDTHSRDRDEALVEPDWFSTSQFTKAYFRSTSIKEENGQLYAQGVISIKDIEQEITFPFEWNVSDSSAKFKAVFPLDRRTFRIGDGIWMEDPTIGFNVEVRVELELEQIETNN